jgi:hypothetical protein
MGAPTVEYKWTWSCWLVLVALTVYFAFHMDRLETLLDHRLSVGEILGIWWFWPMVRDLLFRKKGKETEES